MSHPSLKKFNILIADADRELGGVLSKMLQNMGFPAPQVTPSGRDALDILGSRSFDFLITDWNTQHVDGMELIHHIRKDPNSPCPALPVIMLTGRAEHSDVVSARDAGVNEYVVKPFSVKNIFSRLERVIEQPRNFILAEGYVGPDRRHRGTPPQGIAERRTRNIPPEFAPRNMSSKTLAASSIPRVWLPDFTLKTKLGNARSLQAIVTPAVLAKAQVAVDSITSESLLWVKTDLEILQRHIDMLKYGTPDENINAIIRDIALCISSRAGTFGYKRASEVAYMLYLFCRNKLLVGNPNHTVILSKHMEVLFVILGNQLAGDAEEFGTRVTADLKMLTEKLQ